MAVEMAVEMTDLETADLVVTAVGPVRLVELNRPEQLNAMSEELHTGLASVWDEIAADPEARVIVLTGRGRAFSAGGNFGVMTRVQSDPAFREQNVDEARRIITGLVRCPLPVIAAVNGPAVGLGCSLALLSDLVLIADDTYVADPHVQVGLVAGDGGAYVLPLLVGLPRAKELLFLGDRVRAEDAVRMGIANRAVPKDKLMDEAMDLAKRLAALPAQALRETKRAVNRHLEQALDTVMEPALLAERETMHSPDHIAAVERIIAARGSR
ncbi:MULTISPECIES: enoyl-CoA hydratase/isomerase family protein [unclassified Streptomyces]|uniref:enoyl-CoA hydratase/isomerase family protein n=1 Tax=unclassified Streptomyces TaxID=2593676 RepID=UPI002E79BE6E|nr:MULTISPECIES: enoyl-CoA hydratase/isomerase family protein [unclassified Streptomyces]MEE1762824.1 enoyl-CoA hydratase/isomerase family protein [Streptomyces sp. SP18BB07]MEE1833032.1 enoyl-CoA hydratase/isomerase family protein [Streptomyces sp. SP17KL33]